MRPALVAALLVACGGRASTPPAAAPVANEVAPAAEDPPAEEAQTAAGVSGTFAPGQPAAVFFRPGSAELLAESEPYLRQVVEYLAARPAITLLRIEVHTDARGSSAHNVRLSGERALAIARWLVAAGVDCLRLIPVGFGETRPIAAGDTAEGRAMNRRTVFVNAALKGKPIGGMPVDGGGIVGGDPCTP